MTTDEASAIVLLASSRPQGNTHALAQAVFPDGGARFVDLDPLGIGYYSYDHDNAADGFLPLMRELVRAPLWLLATPLYWYTMSAQAKTFLDRLTDLLDRHEDLGRSLRGKAFAVACSGGDPQAPPAFDEPFRLSCAYLGMHYLGSHYAQCIDDVFVSSTAQSAAADFGRRLAAGVVR